MPETSIGFFPDVGGSFFLPRLDGSIGTYLGLTSEHVTGVNALYIGIATHYIHSSTLPRLSARLGELEFKDYESLSERNILVNATIDEFTTSLPYDQPMVIAGEIREAIDRCFSRETVEEIIAALENEKTNELTSQWAETTLHQLSQRSPTSLKVTLKQMQLGKRWTIDQTFEREFSLAEKLARHPDFVNGVTTKLITKSSHPPQWSPSTLAAISSQTVESFFRTTDMQRLQLISRGNGRWAEYPQRFTLPREEEIKQVVQHVGTLANIEDAAHARHRAARHTVTAELVQRTGGKFGVREKVAEVLARRCDVGVDGKLIWRDGEEG